MHRYVTQITQEKAVSFCLLQQYNVIKCDVLYILYIGRYTGTVRDSKSSKSIFYVNNKIVCKKKVKVCNKQKIGEINLDIKYRHGSLTPLVWRSESHIRRKIRFIEGNAKCRLLKNLPVKGLCGRYCSLWGPEPHAPPPPYKLNTRIRDV